MRAKLREDEVFEQHYYITPPECETREECWDALHKYLEEHASNRMVFFRDVPQVCSDFDFDTKETKHRGVVRFHAGHVIEAKVPSLGEISAR